MKKFISIIAIILYVSINVSLGAGTYEECISQGMSPDVCAEDFPTEENTQEDTTTETTTNSTSENSENTSFMGISCNEDQLVNGQCKFNINETLGIKKGETNSVGILVQDIVLSATFFIGTVVTIALIVSGLMYIFAASSGKDPANAKKGIVGSLIGLLIVVSSYIIIRLVQYLAKGF